MLNEKPKIFISHAWEDKALVRRLENELRNSGIDVWVDHSHIRGGDNLPERVSNALEWCNTLVLVWSAAARNSQWVKLEWTNALALQKKIIPCRLDSSKLPAILANMIYVDLSGGNQGLSTLLDALNLEIHAQSPELAALLRFEPKRNLSETNVANLLRKYDFYCADTDWTKKYCNPHGKGIGNKLSHDPQRGIVYDAVTNLTWQQSGPPTPKYLIEVEEYIDTLNEHRFGDCQDWRLPTLEEAMSLVSSNRNSNKLFIDPIFDKTQTAIFTADRTKGGKVWVVGFTYGSCGYKYPVKSTTRYIRGVRSGNN